MFYQYQASSEATTPGPLPTSSRAYLEMGKGQIGVLLGPSGSGKSTLINIIGGVDRADAGAVVVDGERVTDTSGPQ